jgi:dipeptidyl aminopeptidase/acylaminoacyl peptidase
MGFAAVGSADPRIAEVGAYFGRAEGFDGIRDIKSYVDYLVSSGIADPKRIGIAGGSDGVYMNMDGVTEYPDLFAAGVDLFGIVNFATFFEYAEPWMAAISTVEYG